MKDLRYYNLKLMLVEDNPSIRDIHKSFISGLGFTVNDFEDAESAWEDYQDNEYALVLTDWELPGISGFDFCLKVRKYFPDKSLLIVISGFDEKEKLEKIIRAGIDD